MLATNYKNSTKGRISTQMNTDGLDNATSQFKNFLYCPKVSVFICVSLQSEIQRALGSLARISCPPLQRGDIDASPYVSGLQPRILMETGPYKEGLELIAELNLLVVLFLSEYISSHSSDLIFADRYREIVSLPAKLEPREAGFVDPG